MLPILLVTLGYLAGSVPFGVLLTRWFKGEDVRKQGSGNIGATNVARVAGKSLGAAVLLLDALKGALPVLLGVELHPSSAALHAGVGLAAFLGHVFPVWLKLKGGKGVATALGVLAVLLPTAAFAGAICFALVFVAFRVSSIGSLAGAITAVAVGFFIGAPVEYPVLAAVLLVLMLYTHRANLKRIARRSEPKF